MAAKAVTKAQKRLSPDPCIAVGDLMLGLEAFLKEAGTRDMSRLLKAPLAAGNPGWKAAPCPAWLSQVAPLYVNLAEVAPNTILPSKKAQASSAQVR